MSEITTYLGPLVSFRTSAAQSSTPVHVHIPSTGTFEVEGPARFESTLSSTATVNLSGAKLLSKQTTASLTSATLVDGEFAVGAVSATSCMIYFRSGVTTYRFLAASAAVL